MTALAVLLGVSSAWGQQIVEETSTRFPIPNPAEYTNQLTIGDLDGDTDLAQLLGGWGPCVGCPADLDGDGHIDAFDLALLLGVWGPCN